VAISRDIASLNDYEGHLSDKVQFLLDAILGFISIAQNDIFKVLTIVSVVGIPPTLVAGIYGMNFKFMPELGWDWGYGFGLAMIVLSAAHSDALVQVAWLVLNNADGSVGEEERKSACISLLDALRCQLCMVISCATRPPSGILATW
jgi:CorA-like Mg2+ transporter protein